MTPLTGLRTRNTSLTLRLSFSESLSVLRVGLEGAILERRPPDTYFVVNVSGEGTFSLVLHAVDLAGNVQQHATKFSWTTDTSTYFFHFRYIMELTFCL